tara:strand:- start:44 stop:337 length:294 start_codon:yes stop_codon:yes gene_type:complete
MKKSINEELNSIKFLFKYKAGKVISEQEQFETEDVDFEEIEMEENREIETPVRPDVDTPTKPKKPGTPYSPKPGPKKAPKAKMPEWLSFDAIGVNIN